MLTMFLLSSLLAAGVEPSKPPTVPEAHAAKQAPTHAPGAVAANHRDHPETPEAALKALEAGNVRWVQGKRTRTMHTSGDAAIRHKLASGQAPFAAILTCSDSRLENTLIFDQEPGRLFVVREAGNSADEQGLGSLEYAVEHLHASLVLVLGHVKCGAVKAVAENVGKILPGHMHSFQESMAGLPEGHPRKADETPETWLRRLEATNASRQADIILHKSEIIRNARKAGHIRVMSAVYDLDSGRVTLLREAMSPMETKAAAEIPAK